MRERMRRFFRPTLRRPLRFFIRLADLSREKLGVLCPSFAFGPLELLGRRMMPRLAPPLGRGP
jgi:hypothetical protein